jgi:hypothetical protein
MDTVLVQLREKAAAGSAASSSPLAPAGGKALRAKIDYAIRTMQEGLVERDTEVRGGLERGREGGRERGRLLCGRRRAVLGRGVTARCTNAPSSLHHARRGFKHTCYQTYVIKRPGALRNHHAAGAAARAGRPGGRARPLHRAARHGQVRGRAAAERARRRDLL